MWENAEGGVVAGRWRGLTSGIVIGRAGLVEGQSALTDRGPGDARCALRMAGERWRCTRNENEDPPVFPVGQSYPTSLLSHMALTRSRYATHPTFGKTSLLEHCHKVSEDWLMGLQDGMKMMDPPCNSGFPRQIRDS